MSHSKVANSHTNGGAILLSHEEKQTHIQNIAEQAGFPIEDVYALMYGKMPKNYNNSHIKLIQTLAKSGQGIIVGVIWQGESEPQQLQNSPTYYYLGQLIEGLTLYLHKKNYTLQLYFSNKFLADDEYFHQILSQHPTAGLINFAFLSEAIRQIFKRFKRPIVYIDYPPIADASDEYIIALDSKAVFEEAVMHLYALGHRRIAFIKGPQHKLSFVARYEGYCNGLARLGIALDENLVFQGDWYQPSGEEAARTFLALESAPTAIISSNDLMAFGAMGVIAEMGYKIPDDISIIGFDNVAAAALTTPPLSSVYTPMTRMGSIAGEYIVKLIEGETPTPRHVYLPVELVYRQSTGRAPS